MSLIRIIAAVATLLAATASAPAQDWPTRPVTIIVPFAAGGAFDVMARVFSPHLSQILGQQVIVENVGAATWDESLRSLCRGGRLVTCGATSGPQASLDLRRLFWHHWSLLGSTMGNAAEYAEIVRRLGKGELRPIVDRVYPMTQARLAFERLAKGEQLGKVVVDVSS